MILFPNIGNILDEEIKDLNRKINQKQAYISLISYDCISNLGNIASAKSQLYFLEKKRTELINKKTNLSTIKTASLMSYAVDKAKKILDLPLGEDTINLDY